MQTTQKLRISKKGLWGKIIVSIIGLGVIASAFSRYPAEHGGDWYHQLEQPFFAPAYWMPFVIWPLVYVLMGCSFGLIWHYAAKSPQPQTVKLAKNGLILFGIHLIFNLIFPVILIGFHWPVVGLIDMVILITFIFMLIRHFRRIDRVAANLLIPYLIWIFYATALNVAIIVLN